MIKIKKTAEVDNSASIGKNTVVWHYCQIRENVKIGNNCIIGKNAYIDIGVKIGENVKIQNNVSIYHDAIIENGVFIGPHVCLSNDKYPRAINPDGSLKTKCDWSVGRILVEEGASIGAGSIILPNITIGKYAMIGAGSVVTKDVPEFTLVYGNPAKIHGKVDIAGKVVET